MADLKLGNLAPITVIIWPLWGSNSEQKTKSIHPHPPYILVAEKGNTSIIVVSD
jgi:hypothetical protein